MKEGRFQGGKGRQAKKTFPKVEESINRLVDPKALQEDRSIESLFHSKSGQN